MKDEKLDLEFFAVLMDKTKDIKWGFNLNINKDRIIQLSQLSQHLTLGRGEGTVLIFSIKIQVPSSDS